MPTDSLQIIALAICALGGVAALAAAAHFVHDAIRAARWNAGHRVR